MTSYPYLTPRRFAATISGNATLAAGVHTPVNAAAGPITVTLPTPTDIGAYLSIEKTDSSVNAVTVAGSIRGSSTTIALAWQNESIELHWTGTTWRPVNGHKTKAALDAAYAPSGGDAQVFSVVAHGADRTGLTDSSAAFAAAASAAAAAVHSVTGGWVNPGGVVIDVPPGTYLITTAGAFLGNETIATQAYGLRWRGAGDGITTIVFQPASATYMLKNANWQNVQIEGMSFVCRTAGSTFFQSYTTNAAQYYTFNNVSWVGWRYLLDLQGTNNNSEFSFNRCSNYRMASNGAWLYMGTTSTTDQFLNYWFNDIRHWETGAPLIDSAAGGHFHLKNVDVSNWGSAFTSTGYLFALRGNTHSEGVCVLDVRGLRVEGMTTFAALLYSEWPQGTVDIDVDWSSQVFARTFGDIINIVYGNVPGPNYRFSGQLAGGIKVSWGTSGTGFRQILIDNATWIGKANSAAVVTYDASGAGTNINRPVVVFRNCRGRDSSGVVTAWDSSAPTITAAGLPRWRRAIARVLSGTADAKILCLGDSTTAGMGALGDATQGAGPNYPYQLAQRLNGAVPSTLGLAIPNPADANPDTRWVRTGGWVYSAYGVLGAGFQNTTASGTITFADNRILADRFDVYYLTAGGLNGSFSAQATGGSSVSGTDTGSVIYRKITVSAATAATTNSLTITQTSAGTQGTYIVGVEPWLSTTRRVRVANAGVSGVASAALASGGFQVNIQSSDFLTSYAPDLVLLSFGINDAFNSTTAATVTANLKAFADACGVAGADVVNLLPFAGRASTTPEPYKSLVPVYAADQRANLPYPYIDSYNRQYPTTNYEIAGYFVADFHRSAVGYGDIAQQIAVVLGTI